MNFAKKITVGLCMVCWLWGSGMGAACEPAVSREEAARQIKVFTANWHTIAPMDSAPLKKFAVTDVDGNGRLEILWRGARGGGTVHCFEVNPGENGVEERAPQWAEAHLTGELKNWFVMHPEIAAQPWEGSGAQAEAMLEESYEIFAGRQAAFG